ncbi:MAG: multidrug efflux SMR transporter [Bacteroidetes bacterium]|nr:multidrug efflux SMR transporter [Bacteroidota bacterium]
MKYWIYLSIASICETGWAVGMKYSEGLRKPVVTSITIVLMLLSFYFLSLSIKKIPLGTAYGIWTGIGAAGTVILGILLFKEPKTFIRMFFLLLLLTSAVGLKLTSD